MRRDSKELRFCDMRYSIAKGDPPFPIAGNEGTSLEYLRLAYQIFTHRVVMSSRYDDKSASRSIGSAHSIKQWLHCVGRNILNCSKRLGRV